MTHDNRASSAFSGRASSTRVATYSCAREYDSVARQEAHLRAFLATRPEWRLTASYLDVRPRSRSQRIHLRRALDDAGRGRFDVLLIDSTARLTRDYRELCSIIGDLDTAGVALCSATEQFDTATPVGRFTAQLLAAVTAFADATPGRHPAGRHMRQARLDRSRRRRPRARRVDANRKGSTDTDR